MDEALELIKEQYTNLNPVGLHAHIGSQIFETSIYYDEVEVLLKEMGRCAFLKAFHSTCLPSEHE